MKGYKFKLEAVLKVRKLKEEQCKMEIGRIQVQINKLKSEVKNHEAGIQQAYDSQEKLMEDGVNGTEIKFYPFFVSGKRAHIQAIQNEIQSLTEQVNDKYENLKILRGDVKVIEEMKEKDVLKYKKALQKKQFENIEEQVQNWNQFKKVIL